MDKYHVVFVANDIAIITEEIDGKELATRVMVAIGEKYYGPEAESPGGSMECAFGHKGLPSELITESLVDMFVNGEPPPSCGIQWLDGRGGLFHLDQSQKRTIKVTGKYVKTEFEEMINGIIGVENKAFAIKEDGEFYTVPHFYEDGVTNTMCIVTFDTEVEANSFIASEMPESGEKIFEIVTI